MSDERPQLSAAEAARFHHLEVLKYTGRAGCEQVDPWDPKADAFMNGAADVEPDYRVSTDDIPSIQDAVNMAVVDATAGRKSGRIYIAIAPGTYTETVVVPRLLVGGAPVAITLYGTGATRDDTVISAAIDQGMTGADFAATFGLNTERYAPEIAAIYRANAALSRLTTDNACVLRVENDGFQAKNLAVVNAYNCDRADANSKCEDGKGGPKNAAGQFAKGWHQAVAAMVHNADRVHFENVRFSSFQDTLYFKGRVPGMTVRSYYRHCLVEGDIDFIFGRSTAFFEGCEIRSLGSRVDHTYVVAPATNLHTSYGIVFNDCDFTHDGSDAALAGTFSLGRQWFHMVRATPYGMPNIDGYRVRLAETSQFDHPPAGTISLDVLEAVGKCAILNSRIGGHINPSAPWDDWSGGRRNADGEFVPGEWNARYRPAQYTSDDFHRYLGDWLREQGLRYEVPEPAEPWLAEYNNA